MEAINHTFQSYYSKTEYIGLSFRKPYDYWESSEASNSKIRLSKGYPVSKFRDLVELTARTALWNKRYDIFYRGQSEDYKDKNQKTIIYPAICRAEKHPNGKRKASIRTSTIEKRYKELQSFIQFYSQKNPNTFPEEYYALIQHYDILPTPLIDVTQSLRVAASFALQNSNTGYLYVIGLPYIHGSISHFIDLGISLIKLQNACPVEALRPRYQEGFLVGRLPFNPQKSVGDNLAKRLIGKFYLDNTDNQFWDELFQPLPNNLLFPSDDRYEKIIKDLYYEFKK